MTRTLVVLVQLGVLASWRLLAQCPDGSPPPCRAAAAPRTPAPNSIAVLYLDNVSGDTADAYLADGVTEELIARLSQVDGLRVTSRYGALRYRGRHALDPRLVGRELGVRYVLQGTLRRSGERVRVVVEISDAAGGYNAWGHTYEQRLRDVFALQDSVAVQVAEAVRGRLTGRERARLATAARTTSEAYQAYLRGRAAVRARTARAIDQAIAQYNRAVTLDPDFGRAHAALAHAYVLAANWGWVPGGLSAADLDSLATVAARRALALDSSDAESWIAAEMATREHDPRRGVLFTHRAVALDSTNVEALHQLATTLFGAGELDSAIAIEQRVIARDPYYAYPYAFLAQLLNIAGRPSEALGWSAQGLAIDSTHAPLYWAIADAHLRLRRPAEARTAAGRAMTFGLNAAAMRAFLALATLVEGDTAACRAQLAAVGADLAAALRRSPTGLPNLEAGILSGAYAQLGEPDSAVAWARRVTRGQQRFYATSFARHWLWEPVRADTRFQRFLIEARQ